MYDLKDSKGFTIIELLIVLGLMAMLLALSVPFVASLRSDISLQKTLQGIKVDIVSTIDYSLAGKSFAALSADDLTNPKLIPAAYALYFETDSDYGEQTPYKYLELASEEEGLDKAMKVSYEMPHEYSAPGVYLKDISFYNSDTGRNEKADSGYIVVLPPFGKLLFVDDGEGFLSGLTENDFYQNQRDFNGIKLHFQYKDDESTETVMSLNQGKVINIQ